MTNPLAEIFRYNAWANEVLFAACQALPDADLHFPTAGDDPRSIRQKLMHIAGGQQTFCLRTRGRQHEGELRSGSEWPGWNDLMAIVRTTNADLVTIAAAQAEDEQVPLTYMGVTRSFPRSFFLAHAFAHSAQHRTEVVLALQQRGREMPNLDGWEYAAAAGYGQG